MNKHILTLLKLAFILFLSNVCLCLHAQETEDEEKEEGEAMINHLLSLDSTSAELLFGAGRFHMEHGEYDEAIQYFNRSLHYLPLKNKKSYGVHYEKKNIDSAAVYKLTAITLSKAGKPLLAISTYRRLQKISGDKSVPAFIGRVYRDNKMYKKAIAYYDSLLHIYPADTGLCNGLAFAYFENGDLEKAKTMIGLTLKKLPDDIELISLLGRVALKQNNKPEACTNFEDALARLKKLKSTYTQVAYYQQFDPIYRLKMDNCPKK